MSVRAVFIVAALVGVGPLACADHEGCDEPLDVCDIGSAECRKHVFVQTACARDFTGRTVPVVQTITRDELVEALRDDDEPTSNEIREDAQIATSLRMLALLQAGEMSSEDAAIESYASNVLAFYSRVDKSVTIVETNLGGASAESQDFVLSHEFVHAQQDEDVGLAELFADHVTSTDSDVALRSITEGEAVLFSNLTMARRPGARLDEDDVARFFADQQDSLLEEAGDRESADFTDLRSSFPYPFGGQVVADRWFLDGRSGVHDLYDDPPPSTAAVLRILDDGTPGDAVDIPGLAADELPEGWSSLGEDTLGAWLVFAFARRSGLGEATALALARDWIGDHILFAGGPTDADAALAWRLRFSTDAAATTFAEIDGTPPPEGVRSVDLDGHNVTIVMAVDADALALWETAIERAVVEPSPELRTEPSGRGMPRAEWIDPRRSRFR